MGEPNWGTHKQIPGCEHVVGNSGASDRYGIAGFAFRQDGFPLPGALSVASFAVPFVLRIHGEMDQEAEPFFKQHIYRAVDLFSVCDLVLDLTYCDYIDSRGLALLIALYHRLTLVGCQVRLANPYPRLRSTLEKTGIASILAFVEEPFFFRHVFPTGTARSIAV